MNPFKILIMQPFGWLLRQLYLFTGNYGVALIIFSVAVKIILLPLNAKSKKSMMKISRMTPRLNALQEKYGDDNVKYQTAVSQLYKDEGVNPMGGCLWSFLPLLILFPLYYVIRDPLTYIVGLAEEEITLLQTTLEGLGISFEDVNSYYLQVSMAGYISEYYTELSAVIPDLLNINFTFLGINLSEWPTFAIWNLETIAWTDVGLFLLPLLNGGCNLLSAFVSQKLNNSVAKDENGQKVENNTQQNSTNKMMMYLMPLMTVWIGYQVPAGLSIYWITQAITGFIQEFFLTRHYRKVYDAEDAVRAEEYAAREAAEAERERLREERRRANPDGSVNPNTSKRKIKNQQKAQETPSTEGKWTQEERAQHQLEAKNGTPSKSAQKKAAEAEAAGSSFSGDPERPYARGRAYKPNRYGRNTMESAGGEAEEAAEAAAETAAEAIAETAAEAAAETAAETAEPAAAEAPLKKSAGVRSRKKKGESRSAPEPAAAEPEALPAAEAQEAAAAETSSDSES